MSSLETGLRFCGMVEEPPRPGANGSNTSPVSVAVSSTTSVAILASEPVTRARKAIVSAMVSRAVCQAMAGRASPSSSISASATSSPRPCSEASVPAAPANWPVSTRGRSWSSRSRCRSIGRQPHRRLVAEGDRQRVLEVRAPGHRRVPVFASEAREPVPDGNEVRFHQVQRIANLEHDACVLDVLRGRAPMDVAPCIPLAEGGEAVDQRHDGVADPVHLLAHEFHVDQVRVRLGGYLGRGRLRDDAEPGLDARQRRLDIQPFLRLPALGKHRPHGVRAEEVPVNPAVDDGDWHRPAFPRCRRPPA